MPRTNDQCQDDLLFMQILGLVSPYTGGHFDINVYLGAFFWRGPSSGEVCHIFTSSGTRCCHPCCCLCWVLSPSHPSRHSGPIRGQDRQQPTNQRRGSCRPRALLASYRCPHLLYPAQSLCSVFSLSLSVSP